MSHFRSRLLSFITGALIVVVLALMNFSSREIYTELRTKHSPEQLWAVLLDTAVYAEWNPYIIGIEGRLLPGTAIRSTALRPEGKSTIASTVIEVQSERLLRHFGGMPTVLTFDHTLELIRDGEGTLIVQQEHYRGIALLWQDIDWVEAMYDRVNTALVARTALVASTQAAQAQPSPPSPPPTDTDVQGNE